jgi:hypothetical protein
MSPPLVVVFLKTHPNCGYGHNRVCGSMMTITIHVQMATTIQPNTRCQRAPRSPPSSTQSSSSVSHGIARRDHSRTPSANAPRRLPPAFERSSSVATPSSIRVSDTLDSMPGPTAQPASHREARS